jgi:DNA-binding Lrp family transcriptional regulator
MVGDKQTTSERQDPRAAVHLATLATAFRASNAFLLDGLKEIGLGEDHIDRVILMAVTQSNVELVNRDPIHQLRYAELDSPPADAVRRPISISALAASVGLPFETVRRRILHLAGKGECVVTPNGVIVPSRILTTEVHRRTLIANYALTRRLYDRLKASNCLHDAVSVNDKVVEAGTNQRPIRLVARLSYNHFLRMLEALVSHVGDLTMALILMAVLQENTSHLPDPTPRMQVLLPDEAKRPVTARKVAARLGFTESAVRRRLAAAVRNGWCKRRRGGVVLPSSYIGRPEFERVLRLNYSSLLRLFNALSHFGVLLEWEQQERAPQAV